MSRRRCRPTRCTRRQAFCVSGRGNSPTVYRVERFIYEIFHAFGRLFAAQSAII
ncbi:unnamed protein product [Tenebrio molitor]|nr:unnamed protein product [Tenebrio molitor]